MSIEMISFVVFTSVSIVIILTYVLGYLYMKRWEKKEAEKDG